MSATALSRAFHGQETMGENEYPGSGGNMNSVYAGPGLVQQQAEDEGYPVGHFPSGAIASGADEQSYTISDSTAFNSLRGIARTKYPFDAHPSTDHFNSGVTSLQDNFQQGDMAESASLLPGKYSYNNKQGTLSQGILDGFNAGTSTFNTLPNAAGSWGVETHDSVVKLNSNATAGYNTHAQSGINHRSVLEQHMSASQGALKDDVPLTPFHKTHFNFGSAGGEVDYGFSEPGADEAHADILRAYHAILPQGQLAGTKKELMPVFSGINAEAVEQRPLLQSLAKQKSTLYLGGLTELPDHLRINPVSALRSGSNIPADIVQTAGELAAALNSLEYSPSDGLATGSSYGARLPGSQMLSGSDASMPEGFYNYLNTDAHEPLLSSGSIYDHTSSEMLQQ